MVRSSKAWLLLVGLTAPLAACASEKPRSGDAAYAPRGSGGFGTDDRASRSDRPLRDDTRSPTAGSIHIDDRIVQACGNLPVPHFSFDSASIRDKAADHLQVVARCFASGPLKGRALRLVGRADPRGSTTYNLALGQDRATSVARYLESSGVTRAQIQTMSRGDLDATGTDEEGWERDRRVDLVLGD